MVTRNHMDAFMLMRNNAVRNRRFYSDSYNNDDSERMALVSLDLERGLEDSSRPSAPPLWTDNLEEAKFSLEKLKHHIERLNQIQSQILHRPTLDDNRSDEEHLEQITSEISSMFSSIHKTIQLIKGFIGPCKHPLEKRLTENAVKALVVTMQELTLQFKTSQNNYLKQIQSREERSKAFFFTQEDENWYDEGASGDALPLQQQQTYSTQDLVWLEEENTRMAAEREREVNNIVKSVSELHDIFKDLATMVSVQGTVLDRIDYNIENTQSQVKAGLRQLQQAHKHQSSSRKMCCIIILTAVTSCLIFLLIITKT